MRKMKYTETEQQINNVLHLHQKELEAIDFPDSSKADQAISQSEQLLRSMGYDLPSPNLSVATTTPEKGVLYIPSWDELCKEAEAIVGQKCDLPSLFSPEELQCNSEAIKILNEEFKQIYRLDPLDISICVAAGLLGALIDILLVGIPAKTKSGLKAAPLSDFIRERFEKRFPRKEMDQLANKHSTKVSYDAQDNRHTTEHVEGLSSWYHRLLSLGHDPLLGFVVGVMDIMTGTMTTIDKKGHIVRQAMSVYADRKEPNLFAAIAKQIAHLKSDINTEAGLPVPMMALFNLLQFGNIGEEDLTIAELVQGMYAQGYDFIHFCSMSIPVMVTEVAIRLFYFIRQRQSGASIQSSLPFSKDRKTHPKLATMLFIAHSAATAINAGKVCFTQNPMAINYPQWLAFARCSYDQLKWVLIEKPALQNLYVQGKLMDDLKEITRQIDQTFRDFSDGYIIVMA